LQVHQLENGFKIIIKRLQEENEEKRKKNVLLQIERIFQNKEALVPVQFIETNWLE
jgi:hypothetical protein